MAIDWEIVKAKLKRGAFTGAGAVVSGGIGNFLSGQLDSNRAVAAGEVAAGAALSVGADYAFPERNSITNEAMEFAGYGVQAVGWDEMAESMDLGLGQQTGANVVSVRSRAQDSASQTGADTGGMEPGEEKTFSVELG